jgi:serine/threonine protein kinase
MVCGVQNCHGKMLVHRDIKLENFLVNQQDQIILADFGWACKAGLLVGISGTSGNNAPEMLHGNKHQGEPLDVFSLGCCLY